MHYKDVYVVSSLLDTSREEAIMMLDFARDKSLINPKESVRKSEISNSHGVLQNLVACSVFFSNWKSDLVEFDFQHDIMAEKLFMVVMHALQNLGS